jgi:urease accessory protein
MPTEALQRLLTWFSPGFPVGAFSYSHGIEWAVEDGRIANAAGLEAWIFDLLDHGPAQSDLAFLSEGHRAGSGRDADRAAALCDLAAALNPGRERALETLAQGTAFAKAVAAAWPMPDDPLAARMQAGDETAYPVAAGWAAGIRGLPLDATALAYTHGFAANLVSAGVRLIPLGQSDGLRILAACEDRIAALAARAEALTLDDLGGFAPLSDIASLNHETQYTRLFRS